MPRRGQERINARAARTSGSRIDSKLVAGVDVPPTRPRSSVARRQPARPSGGDSATAVRRMCLRQRFGTPERQRRPSSAYAPAFVSSADPSPPQMPQAEEAAHRRQGVGRRRQRRCSGGSPATRRSQAPLRSGGVATPPRCPPSASTNGNCDPAAAPTSGAPELSRRYLGAGVAGPSRFKRLPRVTHEQRRRYVVAQAPTTGVSVQRWWSPPARAPVWGAVRAQARSPRRLSEREAIRPDKRVSCRVGWLRHQQR